MILDTADNGSLYFLINPGIKQAFEWLKSHDPREIPDCRADLERGVYLMVQSYQTRPAVEKRWEAHRKYIDLQYVVSGGEWFGWAPLKTLVTVEPYNPDKDVVFLEGAGKFLHLNPGDFTILFPNDAHLPGIHHEKPEEVKKVVFKIPILSAAPLTETDKPVQQQ